MLLVKYGLCEHQITKKNFSRRHGVRYRTIITRGGYALRNTGDKTCDITSFRHAVPGSTFGLFARAQPREPSSWTAIFPQCHNLYLVL